MDTILSREAFMQKYILMKASSKKPLDEVMQDAIKAWEFTANSSWKGIVNGRS